MMNKRILAGVMALVFVFSGTGLLTDSEGSAVNITAAAESVDNVWDGTADTSWYYREHRVIENKTDDGTQRLAVFNISTAEELAGLAKLVRNGNSMENTVINLTADIALNDVSNFDAWDTQPPANNWIPIGEVRNNAPHVHHLISFKTAMTDFSGIFNGNGHTISGMYCSHENYAGLFGKVTRGSVMNLIVRDSYVIAKSPQDKSWDTVAGGIAAACSEAVIAFCDFDGKVSAYGITHMQNGIHKSCAGGIVGDFQDRDNEWLIAELVFMAFGIIVNPLLLMAGQDAAINSPGVYYCINRGDIYTQDGTDGDGNTAGGIIGTGNHDLTIDSCLNLGNISAKHEKIGGIAGTAFNFPMKNCYYRGASKGVTLKSAGSTEDTAVNIETAGLEGQELAEKLGSAFRWDNGEIRLNNIDEQQDDDLTDSETETFQSGGRNVRVTLPAPTVSYARCAFFGNVSNDCINIYWKAADSVVACGCYVYDDPECTDLLTSFGDSQKSRMDELELGRTYYVKVRGWTKNDQNDPDCEYTEWAEFELCLMDKGDISGDGAVNVQDISKLAAYIKGKKELTDEEMARADVNGDNEINVKDLSLIAAHVKGIKEL